MENGEFLLKRFTLTQKTVKEKNKYLIILQSTLRYDLAVHISKIPLEYCCINAGNSIDLGIFLFCQPEIPSDKIVFVAVLRLYYLPPVLRAGIRERVNYRKLNYLF